MDLADFRRRLYPYRDEFGIVTGFPEAGLSKDELLEQIVTMSGREDQQWESGQCSGSVYAGDHEHYDFLNQVFGYYSHHNALQRDMVPSMSRFEHEIIEMTLSMLNADAVAEHHPGQQPCGTLGFGGTESILNAMLAYRNLANEAGITAPEMLWPDTAHPAFAKAAHMFGMRLVVVPTDPLTTLADVDFVKSAINANTAVVVASAGNYPYGTIDPIAELSEVVMAQRTYLHVDGCLGGWILPWGQQLGYPNIPVFDFRLPGVSSISADTHKYGYGLKGTSVLAWRDTSLRARHYFVEPDWKGGLYASPGLAGSRSGGLIAATWASMRSLGASGYRERARKIFDTAFAMQAAVTSHPQLRLMGSPTFCFSFTSDEFDIYHLNDAMVARGWRLNGQQNPNAVHMCVTGPQTQPGVVEKFAHDLSDAVAYARAPDQPNPRSAAVYGVGGDTELPDRDVAMAMIATLIDAFTDGPGPVPGSAPA